MKIEVRAITENRNRKFYAIWAEGECLTTHIWDAELAEYIAEAIRNRVQSAPDILKGIIERIAC